jgi:hypothetical protein
MGRGASKYGPGDLSLRDKFAPMVGHYIILCRLGDVPSVVQKRIAPFFTEMMDAIKHDELGLIDAIPEERALSEDRD